MNDWVLWRVLVYVGTESWHFLIRTKPRRRHRNSRWVREKREISRAGGSVWFGRRLSWWVWGRNRGCSLNIHLFFSSPNKILSYSRSHNFFCSPRKTFKLLKSNDSIKKKKVVMSKKYFLGIVYYYNCKQIFYFYFYILFYGIIAIFLIVKTCAGVFTCPSICFYIQQPCSYMCNDPTPTI